MANHGDDDSDDPSGRSARDAAVDAGIRFAHDVAMNANARAERAEALARALLEALAARGDLDAAAIRAQLPTAETSALQQYQPAVMVTVTQCEDKHEVPSPDVDCAALIPLCKARCCRLRVVLSHADLDDGLRWNYARPYELRREADGYCTYFDDRVPGCGAYAIRPAACRAFDCRDNPNVWIDFDRRIPAPMPEEALVQIRAHPRRASSEKS